MLTTREKQCVIIGVEEAKLSQYEINWNSLSNDKLLELWSTDSAREVEQKPGQIEKILKERGVIREVS